MNQLSMFMMLSPIVDSNSMLQKGKKLDEVILKEASRDLDQKPFASTSNAKDFEYQAKFDGSRQKKLCFYAFSVWYGGEIVTQEAMHC